MIELTLLFSTDEIYQIFQPESKFEGSRLRAWTVCAYFGLMVLVEPVS